MQYTKDQISKFPIIDSEFNTRFFDSELVAACKADENEPLYPETEAMLRGRGWSEEEINKLKDAPKFDDLSLLDQIKNQIDFVTDPRGYGTIEEADAAMNKWALRVEKEILVITVEF